jgi:hypothetical protein
VALVGTRWGSKLPALVALARRLPQRLVRLPCAEEGFQSNQVGGALLWVVPVLLALAVWAWTTAVPGFARRWGLRLATLGLLAAPAAVYARWARWALLAGPLALAAIGPARIAGELSPADGRAGVEASLDSLASRQEIWSRALRAAGFPLHRDGDEQLPARRAGPLPFLTRSRRRPTSRTRTTSCCRRGSISASPASSPTWRSGWSPPRWSPGRCG